MVMSGQAVVVAGIPAMTSSYHPHPESTDSEFNATRNPDQPVPFTAGDREKLNQLHAGMLVISEFIEGFDPSAMMGALFGGNGGEASGVSSILGAFIKS